MKGFSFSVLIVTIYLLSGCSYVLRKDGIREVRLGDPFVTSEYFQLSSGAAKDTLFHESGYSWRAVILPAEEGRILIEEDFFNENRVNRIRIEDSRYRTRFGGHVGQEVGELSRLKGSWIMTPLPGYSMLDLQNDRYPSFHFLVPYVQSGPDPVDIEEISQTERIIGIVIM